MKNVYHILDHYPALESYEMFKETEALAQRLLRSGLLRIDANEKSNFVRFTLQNSQINIALSNRQLTDPVLIPHTKEMILQCLRHIRTTPLEARMDREWERLQQLLKKNIPVFPDWEIKIARLIVQSSHPIVTHLILLEEVEVFVSFGFEIGDVMDIQTWKTSGKNSGMQSTDGISTAVYVSCGGNPFIMDKQHATYLTDGFQSLARTLIIAGQEMGHYSDIIRDAHGRQVSRHSADFRGRRAKKNVLLGRRNDIIYLDRVYDRMCGFGLLKLSKLNDDDRYYIKYKVRGQRRRLTLRKMALLEYYFRMRCRLAGLTFIKHIRKEKHLGNQLVMMYHDMRFNLTPKADVYSRDDPQEEEAIACIEALARVPQQVNKWGHAATAVCMRSLYQIYYRQVIPACIKSYQQMSGKRYNKRLTRASLPFKVWVKKCFGRMPKKEMAPLYVE